MIDFHKLINLQYLLDPEPGFPFRFLIPLTVFFAILFLVGVVASVHKKIRKESILGEIAQWLRWFGFIGLFLSFARYEALPYISIRLNYYILGFGFLIWLLVVVRRIRARKPELKEQTIRQETYEKYLPQAKRQR